MNKLLFIFLYSIFYFQTTNYQTAMNKENLTSQDTATFAAGCFWCVEAVFQELNGVESVLPGYMGGNTKNPTYKEVCTGETNHAEVCQIVYNPDIISYEELLEVFWQVHNPTTLNRQGADVGTQYRSAIFYHNTNQQVVAERLKKALNESGAWDNPVVTEIVAATTFYPAEDYHNDYFKNNPQNNYCAYVIKPKVEKFKKVFQNKLK